MSNADMNLLAVLSAAVLLYVLLLGLWYSVLILTCSQPPLPWATPLVCPAARRTWARLLPRVSSSALLQEAEGALLG